MQNTVAASAIASKPEKKGRGFLHEVNKNKSLFLLMLPTFLFLLINNYIPMLGTIIAFKDLDYAKGILKSDWIGFKNFEFLFKSDAAFRITRNTLGYNALFIFLGLVIGVTFAIALNEVKQKFLSKTYQTIVFLPYFLSMIVVAYLVYAMLKPENGFVNKFVLPALGVEAMDWYSSPNAWIIILPVVWVWKYIGYGVVLYLAGLTGIDEELYEAAAIDGAKRWQQIKSITIPLLTPLMIITTLISIGSIFRADFGLFYQVTQDAGMLYQTTDVIDTYVYRGLLISNDIGMASAAGLYQSLIGFIIVSLANWVVGKISPENKLY
ncbi:ABC transporter permease [Ruminiclostridium cellobioparum]|uniref:ABC-type polysaccharide transport system, permease component n=1 Tax=Ruminiclostridium cellobioparum subsp. termitidis CT1112 TaxID=1195236 RepID=S0FGP0_RUMCE|nr:ABC transporter permease subunit [Ruminiclostridium cellobioparum]EMS70720.1 ABC-type polysaccharide transport system, permease component [Ruminiclostridium cellobioparum subsp. termitidis CT1112]